MKVDFKDISKMVNNKGTGYVISLFAVVMLIVIVAVLLISALFGFIWLTVINLFVTIPIAITWINCTFVGIVSVIVVNLIKRIFK